MSAKNSPKTQISIFQLVLFFQFGVSFTIFILATVGISIGYAVGSYFGLSLLQALITIPGVLFLVFKNAALLSVYVTMQVITGACELYWLFVMIFDGSPASKWFGLGMVFLSQVIALLAFFFRKKTINVSGLANLARSIDASRDSSAAATPTQQRKPNMSNTSFSEANNSQRSPRSHKGDSKSMSSDKRRGSAKKSSSESSRMRIKARAGTPIRKPKKITYPNDSLMDPLPAAPAQDRSLSASAEFIREREMSNEEN